MTKYLISAAAAAIVAVGAFATPAAAQGVGFSVGVGSDRPYYGGDRYYGERHHRPGVRVYSGRSSYRDDCYTKRTVKWRNGRKIVTERRICD
jgi:hypothetical protein